jgi:hypothetical protein
VFVGQAGFMTPFPIRRALVAFAVAGALPPGATIDAVELTLVASSGHGPFPIGLHRVLADWGEGGSASPGGGGVPAQAGDATWLHTFFPTSFWSTPGGDFAPTASAVLAANLGAHTWSSTPELVADVQAWLDDPSQNFGWLLLGNESTSFTVKSFHSSEAASSALRPKLRIDFSALPPPVTYCTAKPNSCGTLPAIFAQGTPSATATSGFVVGVGRTRAGTLGQLLYTPSGPATPPTPFHGGFLCIATGTVGRSPTVIDTSGTSGECDGVLVLDVHALAAGSLGVPPLPALRVPGTRIDCQYWGRDRPGVGLVSDALAFTLGR